jgi:hypothetical protein
MYICHIARRKPRVLAVVPSDPLVAYVKKGRESTLQDYYNPLGFFDKASNARWQALVLEMNK